MNVRARNIVVFAEAAALGFLTTLGCSSDGTSASSGTGGASPGTGGAHLSTGGAASGGSATDASSGGGAAPASGGTSALDASTTDSSDSGKAPPPLVYDGGKRGCDETRTAVAHYPGGDPVNPAPSNLPHTCIFTAGHGAMDPVIVQHKAGDFFFSPAAAALGVVKSSDGETWGDVITPEPGPGSWVHPWLYADPVSGRVFFNVYNLPDGSCPDKGGGTQLWFSDDRGKTWENHLVICGSKDYAKLITGPAVTQASKDALQKSGYPSMVYMCGEGPTPIIGPNRMCYRSTDGGKTFTRTQTDAFDQVRDGNNGYPLSGSVGPDGTIYTSTTHPKGILVSVSRDEGDTWKVGLIPASATESRDDKLAHMATFLSANTAVDSAGNVYALWTDAADKLAHLAYSKDHGVTWSTPIVVTAPGVAHARYGNIAAKAPGYVVLEYWGSGDMDSATDGYLTSDKRHYDGYLAAIPDVFAAKPVIYSSRISALNGPLVPDGMSVLIGEYLGPPLVSLDGNAWGGFSDHSSKATRTLAVRMDLP